MDERHGEQRDGRGVSIVTTPWLRRAALAAVDVTSWSLALAIIIGVRLDFTITDVEWQSVLRYWVTGGVLLILIGYATKFYRGRFIVGSFDEALGLALHFGGVAVLAIVLAPVL